MGRHRTANKHLPPRMQLKRGRYYWTPFVDGKRTWKPLGDDYVQALLRWRELEGHSEGAATVTQLMQNALGVLVDRVKPSTFKEFTRAANHLSDAFESFTPADVQPRHIGEYLEKRSAKVSANREIAFLSTAWEMARRRGWINLPNPCTGVDRNKEKARKRVAKPAEIAALLAHDEAIADMVELTLMTALRQADLLNLTLRAIEPGGLRVKPRKTDDSTEAELLFKWTPELKAVIDRAKSRRHRVGSMLLFSIQRGERAGQAYDAAGFANVWRRYFARCDVVGLTWHDLRRTALNLRKRESGTDAARELASHSSVLTTEGYLDGVGAVEVQPVKLEKRVYNRTQTP